jgi:hypothetical protein
MKSGARRQKNPALKLSHWLITKLKVSYNQSKASIQDWFQILKMPGSIS